MSDTITIFGHSHVGPLKRAVDEGMLVAGHPTVTRILRASKWTRGGAVSESVMVGAVLHFLDAVGTFRASDETPLVSVIGGNTHAIAGLLEPTPKMDVVLPEDPDLPLDEDASLIPYDAILLAFRDKLHRNTMLLKALRAETPRRILHVEAPPPPFDNDWIRASLDKLNHHPDGTISSPWIRLKMWRCQSAVMATVCQEIGIEYLPPPASTVDEHGFLVEQGRGNATHGSTWYGAQVIEQITARTAQPQEA